MITIETYMMGRDTLYPDEYRPEYRANARALLEKVNALLAELGLSIDSVSSGYRPPSVNRKVGGAARSCHTIARAVDISDPKRRLARLILQHPGGTATLLERHGLYLENPIFTRTWIHLQDVAPSSGKRVFDP